MKKNLKIVLMAGAVLLSASAFVAQAEDVADGGKPIFESNNPKIKAADAALEKADAEALKAFALAKVKARQKVILDLKEAKSAAMKAEKLEEAIEIKKKIEALEKETGEAMAAAVPVIEAAENPAKKAILGSWGAYQFLPKGKFRRGTREEGTWDLGEKWLVVSFIDNDGCPQLRYGPVKDGKWTNTVWWHGDGGAGKSVDVITKDKK